MKLVLLQSLQVMLLLHLQLLLFLKNDFPELNVDTPIRIAGVNALGYNGSFNVTKIVSDTEIQYQLGSSPFDPSPNLSGTSPTLNVVVDTVNGASPYIFNISLRSVFGMCGMHADGSKATDLSRWLLPSLRVSVYRKMIRHL